MIDVMARTRIFQIVAAGAFALAPAFLVAAAEGTNSSAAATRAVSAGDRSENTVIVRALEEATKHKDPDVRAAAAHALGDLGVRGATPALIALLDDPSSFVRDAAGEALGKLGDHSAVAALIRRLDPGPAAVQSNSPGLVVGDSQTPLPEWVRRERTERDIATVRSLGALRDASAVGPIVNQGLGSNDLELRIASAVALGKIGDAAAVPALENVLQDYYRAAPTNDDRAVVIQSPASAPSVEKFDERQAYLRTAVVRALGEIGDPSAVPVLKRAFYNDNNSIVRDEAADALSRISQRQQGAMMPGLRLAFPP